MSRSSGTLAIILAVLCGGVGSAFGGGKEDDPRAGLGGTLVACKEYGTVLGTFLTDLRGRNIARLNFLCGEEVSPRFSPDGERILFTSTRGGTPGIWVMNRKGEDAKRICDGDQGDWFPDGRRIAFRRKGQIVERSLDDGKETILSPDGWTSCSWPACSPDGKKVAFVLWDGVKATLFLQTLGGGEPKRLAAGDTLGPPRWSPAGDRIAYQAGTFIFVTDAEGNDSPVPTTGGGVQRGPAWSPDGTAIAYCQGPTPRGPWQLAVTRADGTGTFLVPQEGARSVLCVDWGVAESGKRPSPAAAKPTVVPPPLVSLWEIGEAPAATPTDWATFCRERKGWAAVPMDGDQRRAYRGGCAAENDQAVLLVLAGQPGAVLVPKAKGGKAVGLLPLDEKLEEAGPGVVIDSPSRQPDMAILDSCSQSGGATVRVLWGLCADQAVVWALPVENAGGVRVALPLQYLVLPDRFGDDIVAEPGTVGAEKAFLPWGPLVVGLFGDGGGLLTAILTERGQRVAVRKGIGPQLAGVDAIFAKHPVWFGLNTGEHLWHAERFGPERQADPQRFAWRMPFLATWRLTVEGGAQRYSTLFTDRESAFYDKKDVLVRKGKEFDAAARSGLIYLYGRTGNTPLDLVTPIDLVRGALGIRGAERELDEEGLTSYCTSRLPNENPANPNRPRTTWADLSVTLQSLRFLFEQKVEVQDSVYAGHLLDDIPRFVDVMDGRLGTYELFWRLFRERGNGGLDDLKANRAAEWLLERVRPISAEFRGLTEKAGKLGSRDRIPPIVGRIRQLTGKESSDNRKQFEESCKELLAIVGPREELLKANRRLIVEVRWLAGNALLADPDGALFLVVEKLRRECWSMLRDRLYIEGDWRGEDYKVPPFWLGPRPYDDR